MRLVFTERQEISRGVFSFTFQPTEPLSWIAGQSIRLELPALDYGTAERRFTISSAPYERVVTITTRPSTSDFKEALFALQSGAEIDAHTIEGKFVWDDAVVNPILVAAGIGITPYHAMLRQRVFEHKPLAADLLYSYRTMPAPFQDKLDAWRKQGLRVTQRTGQRISLAQLLDLPDVRERTIFLSGPSLFVDELKADLLGKGIDEKYIRGDWFTGRLPEGD